MVTEQPEGRQSVGRLRLSGGPGVGHAHNGSAWFCSLTIWT
jgi:hypothetical protein